MVTLRNNMTDTVRKIIDPHLHFFNLKKGDYAWLKPQNPPFWSDKHLINKNFFEADILLQPPNQLSGFVHIEAGFDNQHPWREIDWLQQHCTLAFRSVAFADITATTFTEHLEQLKQRKSVVGIRHILDERADQILSSTLIQQHFSLLAKAKYSFDAQLSLTDDPAIQQLVVLANKYKTVRIIINHAGWPPAGNDVNGQEKWKHNMQKLATCGNIAIKLSGWEMSNRAWQPQQVATVIKDCMATLGDNKVMLASNFPLCLLSSGYSELWDNYAKLANINSNSYNKITYINAETWYNFRD